MRLRAAFLLTVGLWLPVAGCGSSAGDGSVPSAESAFAARFDSAAAIPDDAGRNKAFAQLAADAASAGDPDVARKSLLQIQSDSLRDTAAYKSALLLVKSGKQRAAPPFAKMIKDETLQKKAFAKVAKGDSSE